ncbi:unnamed protein product [Schistosoma margrebowiei]|uniref:Uncharacterized protein n=1 Tax=Schistosoma margrebowiei TaxID=48269 RepID=A0A183LN09_9TREM|nr:unnamed protein product [Schistosoma margrebowiei]
MSRQFYCMGRKPGELRKPSSRRYTCLLTVVYTKYFRSVGPTLLATTYCGREQTRSQRRKKSGRSAGSGCDTH